MNTFRRQTGFSLVTAIFLLVILASMAAFMVKIGGVQRSTSTAALQGARAYQAARSGIEWAVYTIENAADKITACTTTINANNFNYNVTGLTGFNLSLSCTHTQHSEAGSNNIDIFVISTNASSGSYGSADFVRRRITATISP